MPSPPPKLAPATEKPVVLRIESGAMHTDGYLFYLSENGVWLTERVPPDYILVE